MTKDELRTALASCIDTYNKVKSEEEIEQIKTLLCDLIRCMVHGVDDLEEAKRKEIDIWGFRQSTSLDRVLKAYLINEKYKYSKASEKWELGDRKDSDCPRFYLDNEIVCYGMSFVIDSGFIFEKPLEAQSTETILAIGKLFV